MNGIPKAHTNDEPRSLTTNLATAATEDIGSAPIPRLHARLTYLEELIRSSGEWAGPASLIRRVTANAVQVTPIDKELVVGRKPDSGLAISEDRLLGRSHFRIHASEGRYTLEDLDSKNGTAVNELENKIRQHELRNGDLILAGQQIIAFVRKD